MVQAAAEAYDWFSELGNIPDVEVRPDVLLAPMTGLRIGGPAAALVMPQTGEAVAAVQTWARARRIPCAIVSGGTHVVVSDLGFPGVVIDLSPGFSFLRERRDGDGSSLWEVGAACSASKLMRRALVRGLSAGAVAHLTGSIGGALVTGVVDLKDNLRRAQVLIGGHTCWMPGHDLAEARSVITALLAVELSFAKADAGALLSQLAGHERRETGVGPVFRDPPGDSAARLVAAARVANAVLGAAAFVEELPNRVVNLGGATAADVMSLIENVRAVVLERCGVRLVLALRPIGAFDTEVRT
jgi:UDP-N-acetylmuramate dehydrogenase